MTPLPPVYDGVPGIPTMFRGHEYDSTTESSFAEYLHDSGQPYKPHPMRFRSTDGKIYTPDFLTPIGNVRDGYIDVKPDRGDVWLTTNRSEVRGWLIKLGYIRESIPGAALAVIPWNEGYMFPRTWLLSWPGRGWWLMAGDQHTADWEL